MTQTGMEKITNGLHIVWTIALKDIADAVTNSKIQSLIIGMGVVLLMPYLMSLAIDLPYTYMAVYDQGNSQLLEAMRKSPDVQGRRVDSIQELEQTVTQVGFGLGVELGLVIPADFDQVLESGGQPNIDGYVAWANRSTAHTMKSEAEQALTAILGQPVQINVEDHFVKPQPDLTGLSGMVSATMFMSVVFMGTLVVPHLMFEEKRTKTMDALLVSPASIGQIVVGKALAGSFYLLTASGVMFAVYRVGVTHWGIAILFAVCTALFAVGLGLTLGSFLESPREIGGWILLLVAVLIAPQYVSILRVELPEFVHNLLLWTPQVALARIYQFSFAGAVPAGEIWLNLAIVLVSALPFYALVVWKARRSDR